MNHLGEQPNNNLLSRWWSPPLSQPRTMDILIVRKRYLFRLMLLVMFWLETYCIKMTKQYCIKWLTYWTHIYQQKAIVIFTIEYLLQLSRLWKNGNHHVKGHYTLSGFWQIIRTLSVLSPRNSWSAGQLDGQRFDRILIIKLFTNLRNVMGHQMLYKEACRPLWERNER